MAVAMEVVWRQSGGDQLQLGSGVMTATVDVMRSSVVSNKKRAWGADAQKLMQVMMGQFSHGEEQTLDLLGSGGGGGSGVGSGNGVDEFLEVDPDQPLPAGWEQCLDLKTGELYYVNKSMGMRRSEDPRKLQRVKLAEAMKVGGGIAPRTPVRPAHEFLASKKEETRLRASTTSSGSSGEDVVTTNNNNVVVVAAPPPATTQLLSFSTGKRLWNLQLDERDRTTISLNKTTPGTSWSNSPRAPPFPNSPSSRDESKLDINLNLSPTRSRPSPSPSPSPLSHAQTVCNLEMVQQALKRTEKAMGKREATTTTTITTTTFPPPLSTSSSFSSLAEPSWSRSSPSTSSSSTSKFLSQDVIEIPPPRVNSEAESSGAGPLELVMGKCKRCSMMVMVNKKDPKCPGCESVEVGFVSFGTSALPPPKRPRVGPMIV
ncbi:hypothetical protein M758_5G084700 [Ceratodon purpureus]|nr:hypothetical protein M758_5G084700 [Ceratodon purpureus]